MKALDLRRPVDRKGRSARSGLRPETAPGAETVAHRRRSASASHAWPAETVLRGRAYRYLVIAGSLGFAALVMALGSFG
jgi:hypothetical protein